MPSTIVGWLCNTSNSPVLLKLQTSLDKSHWIVNEKKFTVNKNTILQSTFHKTACFSSLGTSDSCINYHCKFVNMNWQWTQFAGALQKNIDYLINSTKQFAVKFIDQQLHRATWCTCCCQRALSITNLSLDSHLGQVMPGRVVSPVVAVFRITLQPYDLWPVLVQIPVRSSVLIIYFLQTSADDRRARGVSTNNTRASKAQIY